MSDRCKFCRAELTTPFERTYHACDNIRASFLGEAGGREDSEPFPTPVETAVAATSTPAPAPRAITLDLPEPPTVNGMIALAKKGRRGHVYANEKKKFHEECLGAALAQGIEPPDEPWPFWRMDALHFRVWNLWDYLELPAGAKWVVDALVDNGYLEDDSPREMARPDFWPTQEIDRKNRGVTITVSPLAEPPMEHST